MSRPADNSPIIERLEKNSFIEPNSGCWIWTGSIFSTKQKMYGRISVSGKVLSAHRLSYETFVGHIRRGDGVFHKCDTPSCINPKHLFSGRQIENIRDCLEKGRNQRIKQKKHCARGHEMSGDNIAMMFDASRDIHRRYCRECSRFRNKSKKRVNV